MSASEREKLMMAYLDGQMSATEAAAFDESLSGEERERMAAEMHLESGIAEILLCECCCPAATWKHTQVLLRKQCCDTRRPGTVLLRRATLAAAALLLVSAVAYLALPPEADALFTIPETSVADFARSSEVARDLDAIQAFLKTHGIEADIVDLDATRPVSRHQAELLGARERTYQGEKVVELLYACCGHPAKVVMARTGTPVALRLGGGALRDEKLWSTITTTQFVAGVVSEHNAKDLLAVIRSSPA